jgi:hypothetical protein
MTARRCSLRQREMSSIFMVVADVFIHQLFQMPVIHHDHRVDQITAGVVNPSLGVAVLPDFGNWSVCKFSSTLFM